MRLIDTENAWKTAQRIYSDPVLLHAIKNVLDSTDTVEAVVLKFKIGDTAFFLNRYHREVWPIMICSAEIGRQGISRYGCGGLCPDGYTPVHFPPSAIGETVFFTREEAEAALAKMKGGANNV